MKHNFELKAYHLVANIKEVEVFKAIISLTGTAVLPRAKAIFKDVNIDCYNLRHERIEVINYWISKK